MTAEVRWAQKVELAFGADLTADPSTWVWTEMTGKNGLPRQTVQIGSGRANESTRVQPSEISLELRNKNGWLTPNNPASPWYPNVRRGTGLRHSVKAGYPHLTLTGAAGSRASTSDDASLDILTDWFLAVEIEPPVAAGNQTLIGKYSTTSNQRSIAFNMYNTSPRSLSVMWSTDGTAANQRELFSEDAAVEVPLPLWGRIAYGVWLDVDNGAGGVTATFYVARSIAEILADPVGHVLGAVTDVTTSSVFSSSAPLEIGSLTAGPALNPFAGKMRRAQVRAGSSSGALRADPDFTGLSDGTTGFTDSAGRPWTVTGATVERWQTRFVGEIAEIAPTWDDGDTEAGRRVNITASGMLRRLTQGAKSLGSALFREIMGADVAADIRAYWPFEDQRSATSAASPLPGVKPATVAKIDFAGDDTLAASAPLAAIPGSTLASWVAEVPVFSATNWMAELFVYAPTVATSPSWTPLFSVGATGTVRRWSFEANTTDTRLRGFDVTDTVVVNVSRSGTPAGAWHNVMVRVTQNGGNIDWEFWWFDLFGSGSGQTGSLAGTIGRPTDVAYLETAPSGGISFGHVIVTTDRFTGWHLAKDAYTGERAAQRVLRLCAEEGIPVLVRAGEGETSNTTSAFMGPQRPDTLVDLLQECADAELGILCEQRHTTGLVFRTRATLYNQDPVFDIDALSNGLVNPLEPVLDDQRLRNDITVSRVDGSSATDVDQDSIDAEGRYQETIPPLNVESDQQLPDLGGWELHRGTWPDLRYATLPFKLGTQPTRRALLDGWLGAGLGDIARCSNLPTHHPPGPLDQVIEHITEKIGSFRWDAEIAGSPAGIWTVGVRDDTDLGRYDTAGAETTASFVAGTGTSLSVATTLGPLWTTDGAEVPFDINVAGVQLRVTAISGASSPQTFTVQQTPVNGITKTIPAGTDVRLWQPAIRAL